jgi:hypothetical protein
MAVGPQNEDVRPPRRDVVEVLDDVYSRILVPSLEALNVVRRERMPRRELEDIVYDFLDRQWSLFFSGPVYYLLSWMRLLAGTTSRQAERFDTRGVIRRVDLGVSARCASSISSTRESCGRNMLTESTSFSKSWQARSAMSGHAWKPHQSPDSLRLERCRQMRLLVVPRSAMEFRGQRPQCWRNR